MSHLPPPPNPEQLAAANERREGCRARLVPLGEALRERNLPALAEHVSRWLDQAPTPGLRSAMFAPSDVKQETLTRVVVFFDGFEVAPGEEAEPKFRRWVSVIRENVVIDASRWVERKEGPVVALGLDEDGVDRIEQHPAPRPPDDTGDLQPLVDGLLDAGERRLLGLLMAGKRHAEIAGEVGLTPRAVGRQWSRIRAKLRNNTRLQRAVGLTPADVARIERGRAAVLPRST